MVSTSETLLGKEHVRVLFFVTWNYFIEPVLGFITVNISVILMPAQYFAPDHTWFNYTFVLAKYCISFKILANTEKCIYNYICMHSTSSFFPLW